MNLQVQPSDVLGALNGLGALQNPTGTALSLLGLSASEQRAGVPTWAWCVVGVGLGIYIGSKYSGRLKAVF
jgi:predicted transcriptional regulator with HTH domain